MCGRARCTLDSSTVRQVAGVPRERWRNGERYRPSYNVAPGNYTPIVYATDQGRNRVVQCMRWGLVPSFTKKGEKPDFFRMFNARSETVDVKASFRRLLGTNRCLAMAEGFYEWKKEGAKKQPYYIHLKDGRPMLFAALYDCWEDDEGQPLYTYTILTTPASKRLEWLHDRMPAILGDDSAVETWLGDSGDVKKCISPYNREDLVWYAVTPNMGRMSFDGPECVAEVKPTSAGGSAIAKLFGKKTAALSPNAQPARAHEGSHVDEGGPVTDEELKAFEAALHPDEETLQHPEGEDANVSQASALSVLDSAPCEGMSVAGKPIVKRESPTVSPHPEGKVNSKQLQEEGISEERPWQEVKDDGVGYSMKCAPSAVEAERDGLWEEPLPLMKEEGVEAGAQDSVVSLGEKRKLVDVTPGKVGVEGLKERERGEMWSSVSSVSSPKKPHKEWTDGQGHVHGSVGSGHGKHGGKAMEVGKRNEARGKQKTLLSFFGKSG